MEPIRSTAAYEAPRKLEVADNRNKIVSSFFSVYIFYIGILGQVWSGMVLDYIDS